MLKLLQADAALNETSSSLHDTSSTILAGSEPIVDVYEEESTAFAMKQPSSTVKKQTVTKKRR